MSKICVIHHTFTHALVAHLHWIVRLIFCYTGKNHRSGPDNISRICTGNCKGMWHLGGPGIENVTRQWRSGMLSRYLVHFLPTTFFRNSFQHYCELKACIINFNKACNRSSINDETLRNKGIKTEIVRRRETVYFTPRPELTKGFTI